MTEKISEFPAKTGVHLFVGGLRTENPATETRNAVTATKEGPRHLGQNCSSTRNHYTSDVEITLQMKTPVTVN